MPIPPGGSQFSVEAQPARSTLARMLELAGHEYAEFGPDFMRQPTDRLQWRPAAPKDHRAPSRAS